MSETYVAHTKPLSRMQCLSESRGGGGGAGSKVTKPIFSNSAPGGVLRISSDGDDKMEPKVKTQKKSLGLPTKPQKIPGTKINPKKIPCRFLQTIV